MNSDNYGVVSRNMPDKMNESMSVPPLICRDVRATKRRFNAVNGSKFTTPGTEIRIPVAGNFVLGGYNTNVNFKLKFVGTGNSLADFSWFAMFSQIRVEAGTGSSIIIEQVDEPGVVAAFVGQYTFTSHEKNKQNCLGLAVEDDPIVSTGSINKSGTAIVDTTETDITLDLSTVLGTFKSSIPLYNTNGLTVVLTLNQFTACGVTAATITALDSISNIYISANCLEGGEKYEKELSDAKSKNGEVSVMFNTVRRYIQSQPSGTTAGTQLLINDRAKSCLGFFAVGRLTDDLNKPLLFKNSSSSFAGYTNHNYNIAGQMYPMAGINTIGEAIDESFDTMSHLGKEKGGLLSRLQANPALTYDSTNVGTSGILCVNLSKCPADEQVWGKGLNLSSSNLSNYLQVAYSPATGPQTINIYSIFQMKLHIDKMGNMSVEY
jgi:hypothetical protein